jgi:putative ABC transport system permease protein
MNIKIIFFTAIKALQRHKVRSLLTTLGIIIGIVSIICVMSIGQGAKYQVSKEIEKLGSNIIIVISSPQKHMTHRLQFQPTLKKSDWQAIQNECEEISQICPGDRTSTTVIYDGKFWATVLGGTNENLTQIRNWKIAAGDFFTEHDVRSKSKVAVLGKTVAKELFGQEDPIGKIIKIKKLPFKVVGVLDEKGKRPDGLDEDDTVIIPISTMLKKIRGGRERYGAFIMSVKNSSKMAYVANQVRSILRQTRNIQENKDDDFTLFTQDDISQAVNAASKILNLLLIIVASISLLVGGIGIMNIMLVTVTERTKEIGIRMAMGATVNNIRNQFILEAIIICFLGGFLGIIIGIIISLLISIGLGWPMLISKISVLTSLSTSVFVGGFFGYYPAHKASNLNPVDALADRG